MIKETGNRLSVRGEKTYRGESVDNGILQDLHTNCITQPYAKLLNADGSEGTESLWGNGVWYDINQNTNVVYTGAPTTAKAVPYFAGILPREPWRTESTAVKGDRATEGSAGQIVVEGVVNYKKGLVVDSGVSEVVSLYNKVRVGWYMACSASNGVVYFIAKKTNVASADDAIVGQVIKTDRGMRCVCVYVSPMFRADITGTPTITSLTAGTATKTIIPVSVIAPQAGDVSFLYKKSSDSTFVDTGKVETLSYDKANNRYVAEFEYTDLEANTEYNLKVIVSSPFGLATTTETASTAE